MKEFPSRSNASFLAQAAEDSAGNSQMSLALVRLVTFVFININPEKPTDDTGTAVQGTVPS